MESALNRFVAAWNRDEETLPYGWRGQPSELAQRQHTRLVAPAASVRAGRGYPPVWELDGELVGLLDPAGSAGRRVRPWERKGERCPISLSVLRTAGWWREGRFTVDYVAPWTSRLDPATGGNRNGPGFPCTDPMLAR